MKRFLKACSIVLASSLVWGALMVKPGQAATEEGYPSRVVKMIVGFPAGGLTDVYARLLASHLEKDLGQPVVVENKPGAGTIIGSQTVARSAPDGYTLCFCVTAVSTNRFLRSDVPVGIEDFEPVALAFTSTTMLVVPNGSQFRSAADLVKYAKQNPGKLSYSTTGAGGATHLLGELFTFKVGIDTLPVHYKGAVPAATAVATGEVDYAFVVPLVAQPRLSDKRIRALGSASIERMPLFPDLPTMDEEGFDGVHSDVWFGVLAPKGTPQEIVNLLNKHTNALFQDASTRDRILAGGDWPRGDLSPDEFAQYIDKDAQWHRELIGRLNLRLD